jgi:hypothetical protein
LGNAIAFNQFPGHGCHVVRKAGVIEHRGERVRSTAIALRTGRSKDYARILQFLEQDALDHVRLRSIIDDHDLTSKWREFERKYLEK